MPFLKKLLAISVIYSSCLAAEAPLSLNLNQDEDFLSSTKVKSQFFYIGGGINPFPTVSLGYRKLYNSFGSDFSISASRLSVHDLLMLVPGVIYKHLFFPKESWEKMKIGKSVFYLGLDMGFYPFAVNWGGLIGWQFKRKARSDFCEIGINPFLYSDGLLVFPIGSLTYAFMF